MEAQGGGGASLAANTRMRQRRSRAGRGRPSTELHHNLLQTLQDPVIESVLHDEFWDALTGRNNFEVL